MATWKDTYQKMDRTRYMLKGWRSQCLKPVSSPAHGKGGGCGEKGSRKPNEALLGVGPPLNSLDNAPNSKFAGFSEISEVVE